MKRLDSLLIQNNKIPLKIAEKTRFTILGHENQPITNKTSHAFLFRERAASHLILAHVQDAAMPEWECVSRVEVAVTDVNDNEPKFAMVSDCTEIRLLYD